MCDAMSRTPAIRLVGAGSSGLWPTWSDQDGAYCRGPPLATALRGLHAVGVEPTRYLGQAAAGCMLVSEARDYLGWNSCPPARMRLSSRLCSRLLPTFGKKPLQLVDWEKCFAPARLDSLDEREDPPVERGGTDAECFGHLASGVSEPLDGCRLEDGDPFGEWAEHRSRVMLR